MSLETIQVIKTAPCLHPFSNQWSIQKHRINYFINNFRDWRNHSRVYQKLTGLDSRPGLPRQKGFPFLGLSDFNFLFRFEISKNPKIRQEDLMKSITLTGMKKKREERKEGWVWFESAVSAVSAFRDPAACTIQKPSTRNVISEVTDKWTATENLVPLFQVRYQTISVDREKITTSKNVKVITFLHKLSILRKLELKFREVEISQVFKLLLDSYKAYQDQFLIKAIQDRKALQIYLRIRMTLN